MMRSHEDSDLARSQGLEKPTSLAPPRRGLFKAGDSDPGKAMTHLPFDPLDPPSERAQARSPTPGAFIGRGSAAAAKATDETRERWREDEGQTALPAPDEVTALPAEECSGAAAVQQEKHGRSVGEGLPDPPQ
jgi:hypothetical protein